MPWARVAAVMIGAVLVVAVLLVLMVRGMAQGTMALGTVKERTRAGLARETEAMAAAGDSIEVTWSTTPTPRGGGVTMLARLEGHPSGAYRSASFPVADGQVTPMDGLAHPFLAKSGDVGPSVRTTVGDGMRMDMPLGSPTGPLTDGAERLSGIDRSAHAASGRRAPGASRFVIA